MTEPRSTYRLIDLPGQGPEDVVVDGNGFVLTGLNDGRILRVDADTGRAEVLVSTDGRPLGLEVLPDGRILIFDSPKGLLLFDPATSELKTLVQEDRGQTLPFCSNVVAAPDGTIYFSVSTMRYTIHGWRKDIVENVPTGRLYRLSAAGHLEKLMDGILFANGVALAPDGSHVVLAETGKCRLHRYWLKGPEAGKSDILCELPGYPDNISAGPDGLVWVSIPTERNNALNLIHKMPLLLRKLVARLPKPLQPKPAAVARIMAIDAKGQAVHDFRWADGRYSMVTSVCQHKGRVFCGSLEGSSLLQFAL
jgi:sugar lactone lactonase YvrE